MSNPKPLILFRTDIPLKELNLLSESYERMTFIWNKECYYMTEMVYQNKDAHIQIHITLYKAKQIYEETYNLDGTKWFHSKRNYDLPQANFAIIVNSAGLKEICDTCNHKQGSEYCSLCTITPSKFEYKD